VGGRDYGASQFNRAVDAMRQPGSSFKPYVYTTALLNGFKPTSIIVDGPVCIGNWCPQNYGHSYSGAVTLTQAITRSINVVPVKLSIAIGGKGGPKAGRGDVRAAILALLREGPLNGYQIMSEIEERSGGAWRPSPGAVYPALQLLADEGLIAGEESGGRRTFSLTEAGRRHVEDDPEAARPAWEAMTQDEPGEMPGLFAQAARLGGSIVQLAHAGTPEQIRAAERLLEQTRRRMYQILAGDGPADADDDAADDPDDE